jgi:sulfite dehydrogenase
MLIFAFAIICSFGFVTEGAPFEIQLPPEVKAFKQDVGAELANAQCLICHSVEYVSMQPPMNRSFWKSSVQKMQQKYGAAIPDDQIEPLVDYLTRNYGVLTNRAIELNSPQTTKPIPEAGSGANGPQIATKYGCLGCHNTSVKIIGPAYREIAAKYRSDPAAAEKIEQQIRSGGSGKWGPIIMPPFPQVTHVETKTIIEWILGMK